MTIIDVTFAKYDARFVQDSYLLQDCCNLYKRWQILVMLEDGCIDHFSILLL